MESLVSRIPQDDRAGGDYAGASSSSALSSPFVSALPRPNDELLLPVPAAQSAVFEKVVVLDDFKQRNPTLPSMSDNIMELDQACMHAVPCYPVYPAWCISAFVTCTTDTTYTVRPESFETESDSVTP